MKERSAPVLHAATDLTIDRHVGAAEPIDRLLGVADDEEASRARLGLAPVGLAGIVSSEKEKDLGLQRIGILKLVDEDALEAALKPFADPAVVAHQVARDEQEVEKVERAVLGLHLLVAQQRAAQLLLQERGEVCVRHHPELVEPRAQLGQRARHALAGHVLPIRRAAALLDVGKRAVARQVDEPGLPAVEVGRAAGVERLLQPNLVAQPSNWIGADKQRIGLRRWIAGKVRDVVEEGHERFDFAIAIERISRPRRAEVTPLRELPCRLAQAVDGTAFAGRAAKRRPAQRAPHAFGRVRQHFLQPASEGFIEQPRRGRFGQNFEQRIDTRFDRTFAEQVGAERVNRADVRFFEPRQRAIESRACVFVRSGRQPRAVESFSQAELELARRFLRKRDGDDPAYVRLPFGDYANDAPDERRGFARAGGSLDDESRVEVVRDAITRFEVA